MVKVMYNDKSVYKVVIGVLFGINFVKEKEAISSMLISDSVYLKWFIH